MRVWFLQRRFNTEHNSCGYIWQNCIQWTPDKSEPDAISDYKIKLTDRKTEGKPAFY